MLGKYYSTWALPLVLWLWIHDPSAFASQVGGIIGIHHHTQFLAYISEVLLFMYKTIHFKIYVLMYSFGSSIIL
jgi:hypothetical protein